MRLERARAIARGEKVPEQQAPENIEQPKPNVRSLKMRTNFNTNRDEGAEVNLPDGQNQTETGNSADPAALSSTPETVEKGAVEATQPLSPQFAALAKQKRAFQLEKAEFERQKAELSAKSNGIDSQELIARLKSDPLSVLQEHGITYESLSEILLNGPQINPEIQKLQAKLDALEKGVESKFQTNEQRQEEAALTEILFEAEGLAKEGDDFELIRASGDAGFDKVLRLIHSTYKQTGRVLDVKEAMSTVENQLLSDAEKLAGLNKVRSKFAPQQAPLQPQQQPGMRTLTARDTATPTLSRRARAIAAMTGTQRK